LRELGAKLLDLFLELVDLLLQLRIARLRVGRAA
jgi:hypothetical protein